MIRLNPWPLALSVAVAACSSEPTGDVFSVTGTVQGTVTAANGGAVQKAWVAIEGAYSRTSSILPRPVHHNRRPWPGALASSLATCYLIPRPPCPLRPAYGPPAQSTSKFDGAWPSSEPCRLKPPALTLFRSRATIPHACTTRGSSFGRCLQAPTQGAIPSTACGWLIRPPHAQFRFLSNREVGQAPPPLPSNTLMQPTGRRGMEFRLGGAIP
jgi:hypothetical protein